MFSNKTLLITGGTGSFGNAVLSRFLDSELKEIRIFSRDEKKQDDMRKAFKSKKITFHIGDVRDPLSVDSAVRGVDYIFHAAALKQVPSCEFYPMEAVRTNIIGTENILNAAIRAEVKKVICLSTDKAAYPINAMGLTKALMEKVMVAKSRESNSTIILGTRYGNVMASRGSVIPHFVKQLDQNLPLTITNPKMTRFMMSLEEAVELVLYAFEHGNSGDLFVQKSPAATIETLAKAMLELFGKDVGTSIIGTRHGEKLYETLLTREEYALAEDLGKYFRVPPDSRDLNYDKFFTQGENKLNQEQEYHSHNTLQLDVAEMIDRLKSLPFIEQALLTDSVK